MRDRLAPQERFCGGVFDAGCENCIWLSLVGGAVSCVGWLLHPTKRNTPIRPRTIVSLIGIPTSGCPRSLLWYWDHLLLAKLGSNRPIDRHTNAGRQPAEWYRAPRRNRHEPDRRH